MPRKVKHIPLGEKIRRWRREKGVDLKLLANETGRAEDYLKKIEKGEIIPPVAVLLQISKALGVDSGLLLEEEEDSVQKRQEDYRKRTDHYSYKTLTPGAGHKHLKAFLVTIESASDHSGVGYQHEGEEFIYVLKGDIEVMVGNNLNRLREGETVHFNSAISHHIRNVGEEKAELLVVLYTP